MIPTQELIGALQPALGPIERIDRNACPYFSSYHIEELRVHRTGSAGVDLIFKNIGPDGLLDGARVKPEFLYDPLREIETYRRVLAPRRLGTAAYVTARRQGGYRWLFLERVEGDLLWQRGDIGSWLSAARWLGRLHAEPASLHRLIRYDREFFRNWWQRAVRIQPEVRKIEPIHRKAVDRLLDAQPTLIHGDFYPSNILVQGTRICPIDWEMAGFGPGLIDVAALSSGKWDEFERRAFLRAYAGHEPSQDTMLLFDCCRLHLAIQWLGWSERWKPPVAQALDWLREALDIAEALS